MSFIVCISNELDSHVIGMKHHREWVIPEKIHTPMTEGMLENLTGGGVNGSGNPDGRGVLNLKYIKYILGGNFIDFINVSIASFDTFSKHCFAFSNFIILSNYRPLTTFIFSFHP